MAWYDRFGGFEYFRKPTKAERQAQALGAAHALRAQGRTLEPLEAIPGNRIATTFWGKAWCDHIETFSDFANRLPRGRSYVRSGTVIDLKLQPGEVRALVQGSDLYEVAIDVERMAPARWRSLVKQCSGQVDSVVSLLTGQLSDRVLTLLCDRGQGLFPASRELSLSCSCPDHAELCKHLAAVLYGIGRRLDSQPELFFVLRGVEKLDLVSEAGATAGPDELKRDELAEIFGIELALGPVKKRRRRRRRAAKK